MQITFKTLQQQTFKLEIDESATVRLTTWSITSRSRSFIQFSDIYIDYSIFLSFLVIFVCSVCYVYCISIILSFSPFDYLKSKLLFQISK